MLQCGGGNNVSAALLKEFFAHERKNAEHFQRVCSSPRTSPRGNSTGILPCITQYTDIASLRRSPRARRYGSPRRPSDSGQRTATASALPSPAGSNASSPSARSRRFMGSRTEQRTPAFELPNKGIGAGVVATSNSASVSPPSPPAGSDAPRRLPAHLPRHGKAPPYGRKNATLAFYDSIRANGIACLCPQASVL